MPFLRSKNVRPLAIDLTGIVHVDEEFHTSLRKSALAPGDVVIVRTGHPGTAAVIPPELARANCSDLVVVRPGADVLSEYLVLFFNSEYGKRLVGGNLTGAAQKHFNVGAAKRVVLPIPTLEEQRRLVSELHRLHEQSSRLAALSVRRAGRLADLKRSILRKAFTGELTPGTAEEIMAAA